MPDLGGKGNISQAGQLVPAGTTSTTTSTLTDVDAGELTLVLNVSAVSGGSVTVAISGVTPDGYTWPRLTGAAINATGTTPYRIGVGLTPSANAVTNDAVPRSVQVVATVTGSITYGIDYETGAA